MATISNELFLYVCVKHANGGKINFAEVGKECGLKQNAAYMRWSRFKDKLDTSPLATVTGATTNDNDGGNGTTTPQNTPMKQVLKKTPASKKRKVTGSVDDEEKATVKAEEDD